MNEISIYDSMQDEEKEGAIHALRSFGLSSLVAFSCQTRYYSRPGGTHVMSPVEPHYVSHRGNATIGTDSVHYGRLAFMRLSQSKSPSRRDPPAATIPYPDILFPYTVQHRFPRVVPPP